MQQAFERTTFQTSRLLEFFSEKELQLQIGFAIEQWPIALLKELIDNALDAAESAGVPPSHRDHVRTRPRERPRLRSRPTR
jgi:DNA topoisomerase VI subunit B